MLGEKKSEEPYGGNDRRLLQAIAKQIAVVRENLTLRSQVGEERRIRRDVLAHLDHSVVNLLKECPACGACYDNEAETCGADGRSLTLSLPVERTIDQRYRLECLVGKGGMGAVYEARDLQLDRLVAVKIMVGRSFGQEGALRRFRHEARAVARLSHPNIVAMHDYGVLAGEGAYLVMELIRGVTLRAEIDRVGPLSGPVAADWFAQLLDGLAAAHEAGVVHRDLKPENVIGQTRSSGAPAVKILDFGLAKLLPRETAATETLTASGVVMGTFGYMSPEQLSGLNVDARSDIFAVSVMLLEVLTGRKPFRGDTYAELLAAVSQEQPHLPGSTPDIRALDTALQRGLAKDPRDRFASAAAAARELVPALRACASLNPPARATSGDAETQI